MPIYGDECVFNEETKDRIFNIYRDSNLEVFEFVSKIIKDDTTIDGLHNNYLCSETEEEVEIIMNDLFYYLGMVEYIQEREKEI